MFENVSRFWHTVKFLKPIQIYRRVWFKTIKPSLNISLIAPPVAQRSGVWITSAEKQPSMVENDVFIFLGVEGALADVNWEGPEREKLWRYNQHYFDFLSNAKDTEHQVNAYSILTSWLRQVTPGSGDGWEPYPASLRAVNWVKWSLEGNDLPDGFDASLALHARWLMKRLEYHLLGNHLFANAKALVFLGLYFEGNEAQQWLKKGLSIIDAQIQEQVLADGGHFELSPMYHAIAFEDILDLVNLAKCYQLSSAINVQKSAEAWQLILPKMFCWLACMTHPDNGLAFFNDAADGIAPEYSVLERYYNRVMFSGCDKHSPSNSAVPTAVPDVWTIAAEGLKYAHLSESGYIKIQAGALSAIVDVAAIGPDYLPGHAHADTLSFELSFESQRIFVNSGTSCYGVSSERLRQRGTSAHNTVVIDGENSSEVWSGFRVARRARIRDLKIENSTDSHSKVQPPSLAISANHDGYQRLQGKPIHARHWTFSKNKVSILDEVKGQFKTANARYHIHPDVKLYKTDALNEFQLEYASGKYVNLSVKSGLATIEQSTWHPEFGLSLPNQCIVVQLVDAQSELVFSV